MSVTLDQEVRAWTSRFVSHDLSAESFAAWYAAMAWDNEDDLVSEIGLLLAERSSGHRTDGELRQELAKLVGMPVNLTGSLALVNPSMNGTSGLVSGLTRKVTALTGVSSLTSGPAQTAALHG